MNQAETLEEHAKEVLVLNRADVLLKKARELLLYCQLKEFDQKVFSIKLKNFTDLYKRCDNNTQGLYHALWKERLNET